jgi:hypothetical protein
LEKSVLQAGHGRAQVVDRDVDWHILSRPQKREQLRRLVATAGAKIDQRARLRSGRFCHRGQVFLKDRSLGSSRVVLGDHRDDVKQARADLIVEKPSWHTGCFGRDPGAQFTGDVAGFLRGSLKKIRSHRLAFWAVVIAILVSFGQLSKLRA